jgi:RimJ/RimL family protein N-acetyltransferase
MRLRHATTDDVDFLISLYTDQDIAQYLVDDNVGVPPREFFEAAINTDIIYCVIVEEGETKAGVFLFLPQNITTYELQTAFIKEYRGKFAMEAGYAIRHWFFTNTKAQKCIANIPRGNYRCKTLAKHMGFVQEGINRKSFLHNGVLQDQYLFGLCKGDIKL